MSQQDKSRYYKALQDAGVTFSKHYREYTEDELRAAFDELQRSLEEQAAATPSPEPPPVDVDGELPSYDDIMDMHRPDNEPDPDPEPVPADPPFDPAKLRAAAAEFERQEQAPVQTLPPVREKDPEEMAGVRLNTQPEDEPIRTDEQGRVWYQEEVLKPAFPKPRGRRVLKYNDPGVKQQSSAAGQYTETFEVAGDMVREQEARITLPSYQVGIYKDPRFPFRIHTYNGTQGFDFFEVQKYYGGVELVPHTIKRMYVENVLCYDIRTTVRAIQEEFRHLQLTGRIKL